MSQRLPISLLENVVSNAERRAYQLGEERSLARTSDIYAGLTAVTGKLELEYEGEMKGGEAVAHDIARRAVGQVFTRLAVNVDPTAVIEYFEEDNTLKVPDSIRTSDLPEIYAQVPGLLDCARHLAEGDGADDLAAAAEFALEGLYARKQIARSEERGYSAVEPDLSQEGGRRRWN